MDNSGRGLLVHRPARFTPRTRSLGFVLLVSAALLSVAVILGVVAKEIWDTSRPVRWSPVAHGNWFLIGAYAYHMRQRLSHSATDLLTGICSIAAGVLVVCIRVSFPGRGDIIPLMIAILIACLVPGATPTLVRILIWHPVLFVGSISYSIYLLHTFAIRILETPGFQTGSNFRQFLAVYALTIVFSTVSCLVVERPANTLGKRSVAMKMFH